MVRNRFIAVLAAAWLVAACGGAAESPATGTDAPAGSPTVAAAETPAATDQATEAPASPVESPAAETAEPTDEEPTAAATEAPTEEPTSGPTASPTEGATPVASPGEGEFVNPVIPFNFPDPHVILAEDDVYYAYATNDGRFNIRHARSEDLVNWQLLATDALPDLASWSGLTPLFEATPHMATWAPAVAVRDGSYFMYYTTPALDMPRPDGRPSQCIGVAVSDTPEGPFVDSSEEPIVCQADLGGSIDATHFADEDGTEYLIWKNDGNCCARPTRFYIQELSADGLEVVGEPTDMGVSNDQPWERFVIEAPTLIKRDDTYYLFYSGNDFASASYAVGYATADNVLGPYTDAEENPILSSEPPAAGPGHQDVVEDRDGNLWMTYHAWDFAAIGYQLGGRRAMWIDQLTFEDGRAVVEGPEVGPQPAPGTGSE